jgi:hypothetical protein
MSIPALVGRSGQIWALGNQHSYANCKKALPRLVDFERGSLQATMAIMRDEPDLGLAGLSIWVVGRQFPDQNDYWDGNWLNVRVRVEATGATVEARGPIIHASELESFTKELEQLGSALTGNASLKCMEPNLDVVIRGDRRGQATMTIRITPDHIT